MQDRIYHIVFIVIRYDARICGMVLKLAIPNSFSDFFFWYLAKDIVRHIHNNNRPFEKIICAF